MCESHDKLIHYTADADGPAYKHIVGITRVLENKMVAIEPGELVTASSSGQL